jgi:hypothetical protein
MPLTLPKQLAAAFVVSTALVTLPSGISAAAGDQGVNFHDAIGSWFGRAVPVPGETICPPGSAGCPVPLEIIMQFTISADGTMNAIDSNIFAALHTPAHGEWEPAGPRSIQAAFTLMQSAPPQFIGSFKNLFSATVVNRDEMHGRLSAYLYLYMNPGTGLANVDADGFPSPNPLAPASQCGATPGCTPLGAFSFIVRRVKIQ